jgi:hypothetical protein
VSPYLEFLRGISSTTVTKEYFTQEMGLFGLFIGIMSGYCYNWKQVQYSIRISSNTMVDGVTLLDSKFKNVCNFSLNHNLLNEFGQGEVSWEKLAIPLTPILITFSQPTPRPIASHDVNYLLSRRFAVNNALIMTPQKSDMSPEDIKSGLKPFENTMIFGQPFVNTTTLPTLAIPLEAIPLETTIPLKAIPLKGDNPIRSSKRLAAKAKNRPVSKWGGKNKMSKTKKTKNKKTKNKKTKNKKTKNKRHKTHKKRKSVKKSHK